MFMYLSQRFRSQDNFQEKGNHRNSYGVSTHNSLIRSQIAVIAVKKREILEVLSPRIIHSILLGKAMEGKADPLLMINHGWA